jgi:hypothetical protein
MGNLGKYTGQQLRQKMYHPQYGYSQMRGSVPSLRGEFCCKYVSLRKNRLHFKIHCSDEIVTMKVNIPPAIAEAIAIKQFRYGDIMWMLCSSKGTWFYKDNEEEYRIGIMTRRKSLTITNNSSKKIQFKSKGLIM